MEFPKGTTRTMQETHPALIISNNKKNSLSPLVTVLPITSQVDKIYPFEVVITSLPKISKILIDQVTTIDKKFIQKRIASLSERELGLVEDCLRIDLGL